MKNKQDWSTFSYSYGWREGSSSGNSSGGGDYLREIVASSTNGAQNTGDHRTGTSFGYSVRKCIPFSGSYNYNVNGTKRSVYGNGQFYQTFQTVNYMDQSNVDNQAITQLMEKIRGNIDLSTDAFQLRQTIEMVRHPIRSLTNIAQAVRRRSGGGKAFASAWLEYQYGWRPLVSTIFEIVGQAANINSNGPSTQLFTGAAQDEERSKENIRMSGGGTVHSIDVYTNVKCKTKYFASMQMSGAAKARMASTYTSMNPANIAWELLPYSFVVDWVVDIGSYLRNVETAVLYNTLLKKAWVSRLVIVDTQHLGQPRSFDGATGQCSGSGAYKEIRFGRVILQDLPIATKPVVSSPTDLSWTRLTSAIALLTQQFAK